MNNPLSHTTFNVIQTAILDLMADSNFEHFKASEHAQRLTLRLQAFSADLTESAPPKGLAGHFQAQLSTGDGGKVPSDLTPRNSPAFNALLASRMARSGVARRTGTF